MSASQYSVVLSFFEMQKLNHGYAKNIGMNRKVEKRKFRQHRQRDEKRAMAWHFHLPCFCQGLSLSFFDVDKCIYLSSFGFLAHMSPKRLDLSGSPL